MTSPELTERMRDPNRNVRVRGVVAIAAEGGSEAVPLLIRALGDADGQVRTAAARALGQLNDPRAIEPLCRLLADRDPRAAQVAREVLLKFGDAILPSLRKTLFDGSPTAAGVALGLVVKLAPASIPMLCELLESDDDSVAELAAGLLETISAQCPALALRSAIPLLQRRLSPWWRRRTSPDEALFRNALAAIEAATTSISSRPIPSGPDSIWENRPIPAFPPEPSTEELPLPADDPPGPPDQSA